LRALVESTDARNGRSGPSLHDGRKAKSVNVLIDMCGNARELLDRDFAGSNAWLEAGMIRMTNVVAFVRSGFIPGEAEFPSEAP
jgi:hypothetical protein